VCANYHVNAGLATRADFLFLFPFSASRLRPAAGSSSGQTNGRSIGPMAHSFRRARWPPAKVGFSVAVAVAVEGEPPGLRHVSRLACPARKRLVLSIVIIGSGWFARSGLGRIHWRSYAIKRKLFIAYARREDELRTGASQSRISRRPPIGRAANKLRPPSASAPGRSVVSARESCLLGPPDSSHDLNANPAMITTELSLCLEWPEVHLNARRMRATTTDMI
jgi:hypothetical protein